MSLTWTGTTSPAPAHDGYQNVGDGGWGGLGVYASVWNTASTDTPTTMTGTVGDVDLTSTPVDGAMHTEASQRAGINL